MRRQYSQACYSSRITHQIGSLRIFFQISNLRFRATPPPSFDYFTPWDARLSSGPTDEFGLSSWLSLSLVSGNSGTLADAGRGGRRTTTVTLQRGPAAVSI